MISPPPPSFAERLNNFICQYWLPLGYLVLLTGLFWVYERSQYSKAFYALIAIPALVGACLNPALLRQMLREPLVLAFLALGIWVLISLGWTHSEDSTGSLGKRPLYVAMMFVASALMMRNGPETLLRTLRLGAIVAALAAAVNLLIFLPHASEAPRMVGLGGMINPLLTSHVLGFFCAYWVAVWTIRSEPRPWLAVICAALMFAALLATGSRTPLAALVLCGMWLAVICGNRRGLLLIGGLLLTGAALYLLQPGLVISRGFSYRPELWSAALAQVPEHLWLGKGYDSAFTFQAPGLPYVLSDPHNISLAILLELGAIGLFLWGVLYLCALLRSLQLRHLPLFQLASCLVAYGFAAGMTEGSSFLSRPNENWFLIWIPLSLMAALSMAQRHKEPT